MSIQMTSRERIISAINHKTIDKIPTDYWGTPETTLKLMKELGACDVMQLWYMLEIDKIINVSPQYIGPNFGQGQEIESNPWCFWGVKMKTIEYGKNQGTYSEIADSPLSKISSINEIKEKYTWPKVEWFDFSNIAQECVKYSGYAIECGYMSPFYMYSNIRGLENSLIDMAADEEIAYFIINKITDFFYEYHDRLFDAAKGCIDIAQVTDDFGTQKGLMISLEMFDKYFQKPFRRLIKLVKDYEIKVFHHDDGSIMPLIPKMVDLGIDVLNPIQWHLPGMDLKQLKDQFGDKICFHGGIDNQQVLPFGSTAEVEREVINCIEHLSYDGTGYILAPCHNIQVNTSVDNIVAMYRAAKEYGKL